MVKCRSKQRKQSSAGALTANFYRHANNYEFNMGYNKADI